MNESNPTQQQKSTVVKIEEKTVSNQKRTTEEKKRRRKFEGKEKTIDTQTTHARIYTHLHQSIFLISTIGCTII